MQIMEIVITLGDVIGIIHMAVGIVIIIIVLLTYWILTIVQKIKRRKRKSEKL